MKRVFASAGIVLLLAALGVAQAGTLFTNPVIVVTPLSLDFGVVPVGKTATNTFLVENGGGGKLVGKATANPPFKILEGASYVLRGNEAQVVTIIYAPGSLRTNTQAILFSGAAGARATVTGRASPPPATAR